MKIKEELCYEIEKRMDHLFNIKSGLNRYFYFKSVTTFLEQAKESHTITEKEFLGLIALTMNFFCCIQKRAELDEINFEQQKTQEEKNEL